MYYYNLNHSKNGYKFRTDFVITLTELMYSIFVYYIYLVKSRTIPYAYVMIHGRNIASIISPSKISPVNNNSHAIISFYGRISSCNNIASKISLTYSLDHYWNLVHSYTFSYFEHYLFHFYVFMMKLELNYLWLKLWVKSMYNKEQINFNSYWQIWTYAQTVYEYMSKMFYVNVK